MVRKKQPKKTPAATKKGKKTLRSSNSKQNAEPEPELENKNLGPKISEPEIPKSENSDSELPVFTAPTSPAGGTSQKEEIEKINLPQSSATDFGPPPGLSFSSSPPTSSPLSSSSPSNEPLPEGFKRCHLSTDDDESSDGGGTPTKKAKLTAAPLKKPNVAEENILLLSLKDEKNMKWPDIVEAFREHGWAGRKQTLLKNRYRSLKEGIVFWEDDDIDFLRQAIFEAEKEFERTKWDKVAERMVGLGASRKFQGAACEKKFKAKAMEIKKNGAAEEVAVVSEEPAVPADVSMS